ncbi:dienelactone hydrolase family protein [Nitzschia inconspicua]|uniref:Dienelactone hydrolase family protein n=1 Tax=Nitzschia inconspicua TaxID=303405 RepID=A0A9K3LTF7_9STRA|nr:dienelactone hydrolase family protein [Nitzschia inconspicua]KAG7367892.1 dienelactone hydrolase family protein [Nitzschia inconspicua]
MSSSELPPPPVSAFAAFLAARRKKEPNETPPASSAIQISSPNATNNDKIASNDVTKVKKSPPSSVSNSHSSSSKSTSASCSNASNIALLPQHVIDQIAAGEVVQRPVSVVKELLENSLDAGATHIVVHVERGGLSKLSISDNGSGISPTDLPLLATRHATSKLKTVDDFSTLSTFGFRGEAVASTSMVSRLLTVTTRTVNHPTAYTQCYQNGRPMSDKPKPCARTVGTTLVVQDLFYNVPHRQKAYQKRENEEYAKILSVVQQYAVHYPTVGFVCQRSTLKQGLVVDCYTSQIPAVKALLQSREAAKRDGDDVHCRNRIHEATKEILSHVLEANLMKQLIYFECGSNREETILSSSKTSDAVTKPLVNSAATNNNNFQLEFAAQVYCTPPNHNNNQSNKTVNNNNNNIAHGKFILFLNDRLVDLASLKRAMEDVYVDFTTGTGNSKVSKPVVVVNLRVPGTQVDVNVHPSKRQVALMFQEDIVEAITKALRQQLEGCGHTFATTMPPGRAMIKNPYDKTSSQDSKNKTSDNATSMNTRQTKRNAPPKKDEQNDETEKSIEEDKKKDDESDNETSLPLDKTTDHSGNSAPVSKTTNADCPSTSKKRKIAPSKMIRTHDAARAGAIEPFLVSTQKPSATQDSVQLTSDTTQPVSLRFQRQHTPECVLFDSSPAKTMDLSQPGSFASALKCNCAPEVARQTVLVKQPTVRPKRVVPTECHYKSIKTLRKKLIKRQCLETTTKLRQAFFMGTLSHQRSLVQCGEELVMINHMEMAKELFYQLALARFGGGAAMAHLGEVGSSGGIHIQTLLEQALQQEDNLVLKSEQDGTAPTLNETGEVLAVNDTNRRLAHQATSFLLQHADMLHDYFSIRIEEMERDEVNANIDNTVDAILTGLPVLLDGHSPQPHGLPIFLLRLANQVDYSEELPCFYGICQELGNYYSMLPTEDMDLNPFVQHTLFPALSYLLIPSTNIHRDGHFSSMTKLSTLYKVFERC